MVSVCDRSLGGGTQYSSSQSPLASRYVVSMSSISRVSKYKLRYSSTRDAELGRMAQVLERPSASSTLSSRKYR